MLNSEFLAHVWCKEASDNGQEENEIKSETQPAAEETQTEAGQGQEGDLGPGLMNGPHKYDGAPWSIHREDIDFNQRLDALKNRRQGHAPYGQPNPIETYADPMEAYRQMSAEKAAAVAPHWLGQQIVSGKALPGLYGNGVLTSAENAITAIDFISGAMSPGTFLARTAYRHGKNMNLQRAQHAHEVAMAAAKKKQVITGLAAGGGGILTGLAVAHAAGRQS